MNKIKKMKAVWLAAAIASLALGALGLIGAFIFAWQLLYAPLIISVIAAAHAAFAAPFYFIAYSNMRITESIADAVCNNGKSIKETSAELGINSEFCEMLFDKVQKRYISEQ